MLHPPPLPALAASRLTHRFAVSPWQYKADPSDQGPASQRRRALTTGLSTYSTFNRAAQAFSRQPLTWLTVLPRV